MKVADFCYTIDKEKTDCFAFLKETGKLPEDLESLEDMDEDQREVYDAYYNREVRMNYSTSDDVKKLILRDLSYKNLHIVNPKLMLNLD